MELILNLMSTSIVTFWFIIWLMHLCALYHAKLKLNKNDNNYNHYCYLRYQSYIDNYNNRTKLRATTKIQQNGNKLFNCLAHSVLDGTSDTKEKKKCYTYKHKLIFLILSTTNRYHIICKSHYLSSRLSLPGVSIIKPLLGVDSNLKNNLETFFHMNYPLYEVLFCVQDKDDEAIPLVEDLLKKYPDHDIKLFIGNGERVGVNPKINNMQPAYEACKYQLILISDSGISMKQDTLLDMVNHMRDDVALVHQMPFVLTGRAGFQSIVERVYFGTSHARVYLTADLLNINCPTGMSALMRRCLLDEVGGIKAFGQYLAEDFFFAKSFTDRGWKISISSQPAMQNSANSSNIITLNSRIQRWVKLRFAMIPFWTLLEPFSECILLGLLCSISMRYLWALNPFTLFIFHVIVWLFLDYKLLCVVQGGPLPCSKIEFIVAWSLRECTALVIYLMALASSQVTWRSRTFKLKWGGYAEEIGDETQINTIRKYSAVSCTIQDTFLEEFESTDKSKDMRLEKVSEQQVVQLLDAKPANWEGSRRSSWAKTISTMLDTSLIPVTPERLDSRAAAQSYDKGIRIEVNCNASTLSSNQHHLLDMAILAQA